MNGLSVKLQPAAHNGSVELIEVFQDVQFSAAWASIQQAVGACRFPLSLETYVAPEVRLEFGFGWLIGGADGHLVRPVVPCGRKVAFLGGEDAPIHSEQQDFCDAQAQGLERNRGFDGIAIFT